MEFKQVNEQTKRMEKAPCRTQNGCKIEETDVEFFHGLLLHRSEIIDEINDALLAQFHISTVDHSKISLCLNQDEKMLVLFKALQSCSFHSESELQVVLGSSLYNEWKQSKDKSSGQGQDNPDIQHSILQRILRIPREMVETLFENLGIHFWSGQPGSIVLKFLAGDDFDVELLKPEPVEKTLRELIRIACPDHQVLLKEPLHLTLFFKPPRNTDTAEIYFHLETSLEMKGKEEGSVEKLGNHDKDYMIEELNPTSLREWLFNRLHLDGETKRQMMDMVFWEEMSRAEKMKLLISTIESLENGYELLQNYCEENDTVVYNNVFKKKRQLTLEEKSKANLFSGFSCEEGEGLQVLFRRWIDFTVDPEVSYIHDSDPMSGMAYESYPVFEKPLCLIDSDKDGKLMVVDDVLNQISQIPKQLNIVAIAGCCRTGKSYLLNRLAQVNKGFPLGSTIESKTKGIWAWCRPHPFRTDEVLLLLDTEGLGDIRKGEKNHDNWIFILAAFLSSTLVYNAMGTFHQETVEMLSFITGMLKHVKISDGPSSKKGSEDLDLYLPLFILTLRDFTLELVSNGRAISSDEYLEDCLSLCTSAMDSNVKYNTPRMCIRKYFRKRKCFTFERPGSRVTLQKLETLTDQDLDEEFIEDSNKFTKFVLCECLPKSLDNGQPVNGRMFATLTRAYVASIRDGKIPCIESALDMMAQIENKKAVEACVLLYVKRMNAMLQLPVPDDKVLSDAHHCCTKDAIALFLKMSVYDQKHEYQREATKNMNAEYDIFKKRNEQMSEVKSKQALTQLSRNTEVKIEQQLYTRAGGYGLYQKDIMNIMEEYEKLTGLGCKKQETLQKYLESKWVEGQIILQADQQVTERDKVAEIKRHKAITAQRQREEAERFAKMQRERMEDERRQMEENVQQLERKEKEEITNLMEHQNKIVENRSKELERLLKEGFSIEAARLRNDIERLHRENEEIRQHGSREGGSHCLLL